MALQGPWGLQNFVALDHIILYLKTVLVTACNVWTNDRSWASRCLCTRKSKTHGVQLLPCMQNKHENKTHFLKCLLFAVIIWRVTSKMTGAIIISYRLQYVLNLHTSFHLDFLFSVMKKLPEFHLLGSHICWSEHSLRHFLMQTKIKHTFQLLQRIFVNSDSLFGCR